MHAMGGPEGLSESVEWACHTDWAFDWGGYVRKLILDRKLPASRGDLKTECLHTCYGGRE